MLTAPTDLDQPYAAWSLAKLADHVVAERVVKDISHEGLRELLGEEGVRFQRVRTWKRSTDPEFVSKRDRILEFYARRASTSSLKLQPHAGGKAWAPRPSPAASAPPTPAPTAFAT